MNQFSSKQKQREKLLSQFISFTQANEKNAINFLSQHDWKLDLAVDAYYLSADSGGTRKESSKSSSAVDRKKLDQIWNLYKGILSPVAATWPLAKLVADQLSRFARSDPTVTVEEKMTSEGVCRFLQDLHFKLDDKIVLILAWKFKAQVQGEFSREEFYNAMTELG